MLMNADADAMCGASDGERSVERVNQQHAHTWIAEVEGEPLGFATCGPADDSSLPPSTGEIFSIYQEAWSAGTGVGRALLSHAMTDLLGRGFNSAVLWVLEGNQRARRFYERAGWLADGARKEDHRVDHVRHEIRYRRDLR